MTTVHLVLHLTFHAEDPDPVDKVRSQMLAYRLRQAQEALAASVVEATGWQVEQVAVSIRQEREAPGDLDA